MKQTKDISLLQPFVIQKMAKAYYELYCVNTFREYLNSVEDESVKALFSKLILLYMKCKIVEAT